MLECVEFLCELIKRESVTPNECGIYELIKPKLQGFEFLEINEGGVKNLFAYKKGVLDSHFCFMGHIDVVPPGENWSVAPFSAEIKDGFLYGRGAQDMKAGVSAFVCAMSDFIRTNKDFKMPTLSILLTSDEEGSGEYGTRFVLEKLKQKNLLPNLAIVAEPTCIKQLGDMVKIGRRGSINGVLKIIGKQGHVAYPQKCINPVEALGGILGQIAGVELDSGDDNFAPSKVVVTDIRGGMEVVNVTPESLKVMFNIRNSPFTSLESIEAFFAQIISQIKRVEGISCELTLTQSAKPFLTESKSELIQNLCKSIEKICKITPKFSTSGGTSDARFCAEFGIDVVEFGVCNDRIHSIDERVAIADVEGLYKVFYDFLSSFGCLAFIKTKSI